MSSNTVQLHRVLRTSPAKVYRAFLDSDAMARWLPPDGYTGRVHSLEAKVGGGYRMSFTNFSTGNSHDFGGTYVVFIKRAVLHARLNARRDDFGQQSAEEERADSDGHLDTPWGARYQRLR